MEELKTYFREDIKDALEGAEVPGRDLMNLFTEMLGDASPQQVTVDTVLDIYQRGFNVALETVARKFGVDISVQETFLLPAPIVLILAGVERSEDELNRIG